MARAVAGGARLADDDVAALSSRLAGDAALALPASLLRQARASVRACDGCLACNALCCLAVY
jgi:hypothetical protein